MDGRYVFPLLHPLIWIGWLVYWRISGRGVKAVSREESPRQKLAHFGPLIIGAILLSVRTRLDWRIVEPSLGLFLAGTAVLVAGLGFSIWARVVLGRNWSATVAIKQDHELIQNGPYRWVRHPIYTGILLGFAGSAITRGSWAGVLAVALVFAGFWFKLRREEVWMREIFGERYVAYSQKTARLIPFLL